MEIKFNDMDSFKGLLVRKGMSQAELARKSEVTQPYLNSVINGKRVPGIKFCEKVCEALDMEFDELFRIFNEKKITFNGVTLIPVDGCEVSRFQAESVIGQYMSYKKQVYEQKNKYEETKSSEDYMFLSLRREALSGFMTALSSIGILLEEEDIAPL